METGSTPSGSRLSLVETGSTPSWGASVLVRGRSGLNADPRTRSCRAALAVDRLRRPPSGPAWSAVDVRLVRHLAATLLVVAVLCAAALLACGPATIGGATLRNRGAFERLHGETIIGPNGQPIPRALSRNWRQCAAMPGRCPTVCAWTLATSPTRPSSNWRLLPSSSPGAPRGAPGCGGHGVDMRQDTPRASDRVDGPQDARWRFRSSAVRLPSLHQSARRSGVEL